MENAMPISLAEGLDLLRAVESEYVWGVRSVTDCVLRLDFGAPHLKVHEPGLLPSDATPGMIAAMGRRIVIATGRWHLFVADGLWTVTTEHWSCRRFDTDELDRDRCLGQLCGQALKSIAWARDKRRWIFNFDLGGVLTIDAPTAPPDHPVDGEWTLFCDGRYNLTCVRDDTLTYDDRSSHVGALESVAAPGS